MNPAHLFEMLKERGLHTWVGVPDSSLQPLLDLVLVAPQMLHTVASNECEAIAIASGNYLASGRPSVVYLQNSGLGKTVHPLTSLYGSELARIPMLMLVGWRGKLGGKPDEPQHQWMGRVTPQLLDLLQIPYRELEENNAASVLPELFDLLKEGPAALLVPHQLLKSPDSSAAIENKSSFSWPLRWQIIEKVLDTLPSDTYFFSTTGKTSRELFELRKKRSETHARDFYCVGGMGTASSLALGFSQIEKNKKICILDGDGAAWMQLGSWGSVIAARPENLVHLVIENNMHESTGGQPLSGDAKLLIKVARALGYPICEEVEGLSQLEAFLKGLHRGPYYFQVRSQSGSLPNLGRPDLSPAKNVELFLRERMK